MLDFHDFELNLMFNPNFSCSTTFYTIRKLTGGLSSENWKTKDPVSSMSLAHPWLSGLRCASNLVLQTKLCTTTLDLCTQQEFMYSFF